MDGRKIDTRGLNNPEVAHWRNRFDAHIDRCTECQPKICRVAETLWRNVCLTALRTAGGA